MLPYQMIAGGRVPITTAQIASGFNVSCVSQNPPDYILFKNLTAWGKKNVAGVLQWEWERSMGNGYAKGILQAAENSTPQLPAMSAYTLPATGAVAVDAISVFDTANPPTFATLASTEVTHDTWVVSMASTANIFVGDVVRLINVVGMQQASGIDYQVTAVNTDTSITLGMQAAAVTASANSFADADTTATVLKHIPGRFYPRYRFIAGITRAAQATVYFTVANDFTPGEFISLRIPGEYGSGAWASMNNRAARVLSVTNSATESSVVLDLDTSGITSAYVSPVSDTADNGWTQAVAVPSSSGVIPNAGSATVPQQPPGTNLLDSFDNRNTRIIHFGAALFNVSGHLSLNGDIWMWQAFKYDDYKIGTV